MMRCYKLYDSLCSSPLYQCRLCERLCLSCCLVLLYALICPFPPSLAPVSLPPSKNRLSSSMNPVYSPVQPGAPYGNPKNMAYTGETRIHYLAPIHQSTPSNQTDVIGLANGRQKETGLSGLRCAMLDPY